MKRVTKKFEKIAVMAILVLSIGINFVGPVFSGTSISGVATCHVPYLITLSDGTKVAAESEASNQETNLTSKPTENKDVSVAEESPDLIKQQEEVVSEDSTEAKLITTVCAK